MNRSSRLHWCRPIRRRAPNSAGVVCQAGFGRSGFFFTEPSLTFLPTKLGELLRGPAGHPGETARNQRSGGVESRHAARSQPLRAERPLRVIGGMRSSRLRSATREPAQALDQCHPAAGVAPGPLHPSSPTGRDIGAVSCHGAGPLSDSPRSSMPSSRCRSSHSDHMLRLSGSASVAMNELCAGPIRIARKAKSAGLSAPNAAELKRRLPRSRDGACR